MTIHAAIVRELRLDRLRRDFGALNALRDITLTIQQGEFIALLGPSGCGKSTTLNCIAGLLPATGGGIWLDERRIDTLRPEQRGFGMVFQNYALFPHMTVRKNIGFGLMMRGVAKAEAARRVDEAIALVRLQGQEDKLPGQLSGGQQQRVAIARAIVDRAAARADGRAPVQPRRQAAPRDARRNPPHPHACSAPPPSTSPTTRRRRCRLADRIVVLKDGVIRQVGTPAELYARPDAPRRRRVHGLPQRRPRHRRSPSRATRAIVRVGNAGLRGHARGPSLPVPQPSSPSAPKTSSPSPAANHGRTRRSPPNSAAHDFTGFARMADGTELVFTSPTQRAAAGAAGHLAADPARALRLTPHEHHPARPAASPPAGSTASPCSSSPPPLSWSLTFVYPFLYGLVLSFNPKAGGCSSPITSPSSPTRSSTTPSGPPSALPSRSPCSTSLLAVPIAFRVRLMRRQRLLTTILVIPITLGTVLVAEGLLNYLGPQGWFNRTLIAARPDRQPGPPHP